MKLPRLFNPLIRLAFHSFPQQTFIRWLERATLFYIGLPVAIWLCGWLHLWVGLPLLVLLIWSFRDNHPEKGYATAPPKEYQRQISSWALGLVALLVGALVLYSGAGGFNVPSQDWDKHFAIVRDLVEQPWPVRYRVEDQTYTMSYYLAYYMVPALVGDIWNWHAACVAIVIWTTLGGLLAIYWFIILVSRNTILVAIYFIFANGLDFIGERLISGTPFRDGTVELDWWAGPCFFLNYPGQYSQLIWAPQHSLAAWSATGMLAYQLVSGRGIRQAGLLASLASFWSPFTAIGFLPMALIVLFQERFRHVFTVANITGILLIGMNFLFLSSLQNPPPTGFIWNFFSLYIDWPRLALFLILEFGLFCIFASELRKSENPRFRYLYWTAALSLILIPFYRAGAYNDWCMRVSIPALFLIWVGVARSVSLNRNSSDTRILITLILFGAMGQLPGLVEKIQFNLGHPGRIDEYLHITQISTDRQIVNQYLGNEKSFFYKYLAPATSAVDVEYRKP